VVKGSERVGGIMISGGGNEVQLEIGEVILEIERIETWESKVSTDAIKASFLDSMVC